MIFVHPVGPERVDRIVEQQHFEPARLEAFQHGGLAQCLDPLPGEDIDRLLLGLHAADVVIERGPAFDGAGTEAQQAEDVLLVVEILPQPFLEDRPEILDEGQISRIVGAALELGEDAVDQCLAHARDDGRGLQHLARDVERQVLGIDHALDETKPGGKEPGAVGDEHAPHMQADMRLTILVENGERPARRDEEEGVEFERAFRPPVQRHPGLIEEMAEMAVKRLVILLRHLLARLAPERGALVGGQILAVAADGDRPGDVIGPFADDGFETVRIEELVGIRLEMEDDVGSRPVAFGGRDGELAASFRGPAMRDLAAGAARDDLDPLGDHEGGIEAHPELADEIGPLLGLRLGEFGAEGKRAGAGDGAEMGDQLLAIHPDPVIGNGEGAGGTVRNDADRSTLGEGKGGLGERGEPAAIQRVGCVGDELAQEYLAIGIEGMNDEIEQALDFGAEGKALGAGVLGLGCLGHRNPPFAPGICPPPRPDSRKPPPASSKP